MKAQTVRRFDKLGRIVISEDMRAAMGWDMTTRVAVIRQKNQIVLRTARETCFLCGADTNLYNVRDRCLCHDCIAEINREYDCR